MSTTEAQVTLHQAQSCGVDHFAIYNLLTLQTCASLLRSNYAVFSFRVIM